MNNFSNYHLSILLLIIKNNLTLDELLFNGLEYSQISKLLVEALTLELITNNDDGKLVITTKGYDFLNTYVKNNKLNNINKWILPLDSERLISKFDKFDIYLPKRKKEG